MNFSMTTPCKDCPFRHGKVFPLHPNRAAQIMEDITDGGMTFSCHKTVDYDGEDDYESECHTPGDSEIHCAGALILLEKIGQPGQMMRIAERLGMYDPGKLDMDAPVYDSPGEMIEAIEQLWKKDTGDDSDGT